MKKIIISLLLLFIIPVSANAQEKSIDTFYTEAILNVIEIANNEIGYLEKNSNNQLYDKQANAGLANYTKYAAELDSLNFYEGSKQGAPWCDTFVDWCFYKAFGVADAKTITCQNPYGSAGCSSSANLFAAEGRLTQQPQPGDQIFFGSTHTGLVYKVENNIVYTIEGNANIGGIDKTTTKSYNINSNRITGYGRPNYNLIAEKKKKEQDLAKIKRKGTTTFSSFF